MLVATDHIRAILKTADLVERQDAVIQRDGVCVVALLGRRAEQAVKGELDEGLIGTWNKTLQASL